MTKEQENEWNDLKLEMDYGNHRIRVGQVYWIIGLLGWMLGVVVRWNGLRWAGVFLELLGVVIQTIYLIRSYNTNKKLLKFLRDLYVEKLK